jgi:hypothetical protein
VSEGEAGQSSGDPTEHTLVELILDGAGVLPCARELGLDPNASVKVSPSQEPNPRYIAARLAVTAWLLDRRLPLATGAKEAPEMALARQAHNTLTALPIAEQQARVAAWRDVERTCSDADRLELLVGTDQTR